MTVQAQTTTFQRSAEERGSWPTGRATALALLPLLAFAAVALAIDGRKELVLPSSQVVWSVLVPLALAYPIVAAIARVNAYAPTTVLVTAAIAPAFAVAGRLLTEPIARDAAGRAIIDSTVLWERAMPHSRTASRRPSMSSAGWRSTSSPARPRRTVAPQRRRTAFGAVLRASAP